MITVRKLIKELKKMPLDSIVAIQDHDADDYTISSFPRRVDLKNFDHLRKDQEKENIWDIEGDIVVIHC